MALRLAEAKAKTVAAKQTSGLVIGSDQTVECDQKILGKPMDAARAKQQLQAMRGKTLRFHTGLCVINVATGQVHRDVVDYVVSFRDFSDAEIDRYLAVEEPFNCAGSFKSEALGISLLENMRGDDPTALIGLPLIRLSQILRQEGLPLP